MKPESQGVTCEVQKGNLLLIVKQTEKNLGRGGPAVGDTISTVAEANELKLAVYLPQRTRVCIILLNCMIAYVDLNQACASFLGALAADSFSSAGLLSHQQRSCK